MQTTQLNELITRLGLNGPDSAQTTELLKKFKRLDRQRIKNLGRLLATLHQLTVTLHHGPPEIRDNHGLREWVEQYGQELKQLEFHVQRSFGPELENELKAIGRPLSGHYPLLKSGLLTLETDFSRYRIRIWYGPRQEQLATCVMEANETARRLLQVSNELGGGLIYHSFGRALRRAYEQFMDDHILGPAPIVALTQAIGEFVTQNGLSIEKKRFTRADLSYNLFRFSDYLMTEGWRLKVASRAFTRRRKDFLWIPDNEFGLGAYYSHIELRR